MASPNVPGKRGQHLRMRGKVGVGELGPLPTFTTMTLPGVIGWRSPTTGTLSTKGEGGRGTSLCFYPAVVNVLGTGTRGTLYDSPSQVTSPITPHRYPLGWGFTPVMVHVLCRTLTAVRHPRV